MMLCCLNGSKQPFMRDEWRFEVSTTFLAKKSQVLSDLSMKGGYTEAELLAAEWSKQRKKQSEESENRKDDRGRDDEKVEWKHDDDRASTYRRHERKRHSDSRDIYSSGGSGRFDGRSNFRRSGDTGARTSHRNDDRDHGMIERRTDNDGERIERKMDIDEFGREIAPGRTAPGRRRDSRSRSRSRTRSAPRNRSRSRSRSRSRQRPDNRRENSSWKHDKFDRDQSPDREDKRRQILQDYRPPSPTWISKAGGVAIMKRKDNN